MIIRAMYCKEKALNAALHRCNVNTAMMMVTLRHHVKERSWVIPLANHSMVHWQDTILDALFSDKLYDDGAILELLLLFLGNF